MNDRIGEDGPRRGALNEQHQKTGAVIMNEIAECDIDATAARRLLEHIRCALESVTVDVIEFQDALNSPPGALAELADKVLDREWLVDGMDIRDFMPNPGNPSGDITA